MSDIGSDHRQVTADVRFDVSRLGHRENALLPGGLWVRQARNRSSFVGVRDTATRAEEVLMRLPNMLAWLYGSCSKRW